MTVSGVTITSYSLVTEWGVHEQDTPRFSALLVRSCLRLMVSTTRRLVVLAYLTAYMKKKRLLPHPVGRMTNRSYSVWMDWSRDVNT